MSFIREIIDYIINMFGRNDPYGGEEMDDYLYERESTITIIRDYHERGTAGTIFFPDGTEFGSVELPWLNNEVKVSCIPEGLYPIRKRISPLITRLTKGRRREFTEGYEICEVDGRTFIMFHQANYPHELEGCVAMGSRAMNGSTPVVWSSYDAFCEFMDKMVECDIKYVYITSETGEPEVE